MNNYVILQYTIIIRRGFMFYTLIELSISGNIYFFLNNLSQKQLLCLTEFAHVFFSDKHAHDKISMEEFVNIFHEKYNIKLIYLPINAVITV